MAMPSVPNTSAGSGTIPGEARTIPTMAVNTINKLTLGFVSDRYSRHRGRDSAVISESWEATAKQGYRCICISRSMGIMLWFRCAMMIIDPNTSRPTTKMPKASARILFVWSGALEMCRKNTK
jgi:hypothetical protein